MSRTLGEAIRMKAKHLYRDGNTVMVSDVHPLHGDLTREARLFERLRYGIRELLHDSLVAIGTIPAETTGSQVNEVPVRNASGRLETQKAMISNQAYWRPLLKDAEPEVAVEEASDRKVIFQDHGDGTWAIDYDPAVSDQQTIDLHH